MACFEWSAGRPQGGELGLVQWRLGIAKSGRFFRLERGSQSGGSVTIVVEKAMDKAFEDAEKMTRRKSSSAGAAKLSPGRKSWVKPGQDHATEGSHSKLQTR